MFLRVDGTTDLSAIPSAFIPELPSGRFAGRPGSESSRLDSRDRWDFPVLAFGIFHACSGSSTPPCPGYPHRNGIAGVAFPTQMTRSAHENTDFGAQLAGLRFPLHGRSARRCYRGRTSAGGRSCWLDLLRKKLSFSILNRFYPGTPLLWCPTMICLSGRLRVGWNRREKRSQALQRCNLTRDTSVDGAPTVSPVLGEFPFAGDSFPTAPLDTGAIPSKTSH